MSLYAICKPIAVAIMKLLFRVEARGAQHVPAAGPVLLVANHSSVLDPPLVGGMTPRKLTFLAKAELFEIPGLGGLIRRLNARPLRREGADPSALRLAQRVLQEGGALLVFPEGTRGDEGVLREAKLGAALLAMQTGAAVVPVYVHGSGRALPRGRWLPRPAKVVVTFGAPLTFPRAAGADRKAQYEEASRRMMAAIAQLKDDAVRGAGVAGARRPLQIH
jgi:1-acyl-sn-glycerol-3-phosphate acyltransferase